MRTPAAPRRSPRASPRPLDLAAIRRFASAPACQVTAWRRARRRRLVECPPQRPASRAPGPLHAARTSPPCRRARRAVGENALGKRRLLHPQVVPQQALEHGAQVDRGLEVASFVQSAPS